MVFSSVDGAGDDKHSSIGLIEIASIFAMNRYVFVGNEPFNRVYGCETITLIIENLILRIYI